MSKQIVFGFTFLVTLCLFVYTVIKLMALFRLTKKAFPVRDINKRLVLTLKVAFGQTKIFRKPIVGLMHALVFWGFCVILIGSLEMVVDGLTGSVRALHFFGVVYNIVTASGDIFAGLILILISAFIIRRTFLKIKRFSGPELSHKNHLDATISLLLILFLMVSLLGINMFDIQYSYKTDSSLAGIYPLSQLLSPVLKPLGTSPIQFGHEFCWWSHILLIFFFANYLPYSKHFHVFLSIPNVFLSNLNPLGKLNTMEHVTREVKLMMNPQGDFSTPAEGANENLRFGLLDVEDITWKNYLDSLSCTQCGRCTSVCPANLTGKKLSPRKIMMDIRARMKEKGKGLIKNGSTFSDQKALLRDYILPEELWACTTCNACARECPVNINQPSVIIEMRRYIVMEESGAPGELNSMFSNIENNGAPWQFSQHDRMKWAEGLTMNVKQSSLTELLSMESKQVSLSVPIMSQAVGKGRKPEYLFWVGSAGAFDDRYKHVTRAFIKILTFLKIDYAVLGVEESSSGDIARRAGNEMLFQLQALMNIELFKGYGVTRILTCDPHAYNTFRNEYPDLGGNCEVIHHSQFLYSMISSGRLVLNTDYFKNQTITYHDPCYLGRANGEYAAPRKVIHTLSSAVKEMSRNRSFALCCGAGGGQMFKEAEKGDKEIFMERTDEALETGAGIIATACPYCMVMMTDGIKYKNKEHEIKVLDLAEMVAKSLDL